jgi:hypothetical protein
VTLIFTLSMPNVASWNGKWSGAGNLYAIVTPFTTKKAIAKAREILEQRNFYYNFGDGWGASVAVHEATSQDARNARKQSKGFCGYDWMVQSIIEHGKIIT